MILPIIPYDTIDEAIGFVKQKPKPLALYLFSRNKETQSGSPASSPMAADASMMW